MAGYPKERLRNLVNLVTSRQGTTLHHVWICNKCFKVHSSYESLRAHKQERHAY